MGMFGSRFPGITIRVKSLTVGMCTEWSSGWRVKIVRAYDVGRRDIDIDIQVF